MADELVDTWGFRITPSAEATAGTGALYPLIDRLLVHLTGACNLRCKHCYASAWLNHSLDLKSVERVITLAECLGKPLDLSGGEPFLSEHFDRVLAMASERGVSVESIFTNGTLITEGRRLDMIAGRFPRLVFFISLDGFEISHDEFRGRASFSAALNAATILKRRGFRVFVNTMLHRGLDVADLRRLYLVIRAHRFDRWRLDTPFDSGRWPVAKASQELALAEAFGCFAAVLNWMLEDGLPCEFELDHALKFIGGTFRYMDSFHLDDPVCPCRLFVVWPDGSITWCQDLHRDRDVVGSIFDAPTALYRRYAPYKTRTIRDLLVAGGRELATCRACASLPNCGVGCRANAVLLNGSELKADPELCALYGSKVYRLLAAELREYAITRGLEASR